MTAARGADAAVAPAARPAPRMAWSQPDAAQRTALAGWALLLVAILAVHWPTVSAMASIWWNYETYTHALLVTPIVVWLVWRLRSRVAGVPVAPSWLAAVGLVVLSVVVKLAELVAVNALGHWALVAMVVLSVPAVFGWGVARRLAFPLGFLFFAVPFGDFLTPLLMRFTADFTVAALQISGIPVQRQGMQFVIPSGTWSVVEACSGLRYLMASIMVGTLFAYINYATLGKRLVFIAVATLVPVVANWLRAYMIVMIGHLSSNQLAAGVDHLIYGWVFFGIVVMAMFWIGMRWADADVLPPPGAHGAAPLPARAGIGRSLMLVALLAAVGIALPEAAARALIRPTASQPVDVALPAGAGAWRDAFDPAPLWQPSLVEPNGSARRAYAVADGSETVGVLAAVWRGQTPERKLVSSSNAIVASNDPSWLRMASDREALQVGGKPVIADAARIESRGAYGSGGPALHVWRFYEIDGAWVGGDLPTRVAAAVQRLRGHGDQGTMVIVYTRGSDAQAARRSVQRFLDENSGTLLKALHGAAPRG